MQTDYKQILSEADKLTDGIPYGISNLANVSALLFHRLQDINWAGFYLREGEQLILGPFQGKTACIQIPLGRGVCGTAAEEDKTILVPDVHLFSGHIACDSDSRSEIVVPLHRGEKVAAVLDIDSPVLCRFTEEDRLGLESLAAMLEKRVFSGR